MVSQDIVYFALVVLTAGSAAGFVAGLFGIGGGILTVPVILTILKMRGIAVDTAMHVAVGTSLMTIWPTSLMSFKTHWKHKAVDLRVLKLWAPFLVIGAASGSALAQQAPGKILGLIFASLALGIAVYMTFFTPHPQEGESVHIGWKHRTAAFFISGLSSMVGVGGGALAVPTMVAFRIPMHKAVGTASAVGFCVSIPSIILLMIMPTSGILPPGCVGYVNLLAFVLLAPATMIMAPLGAKVAHRLNAAKLRQAFAVLLVIMAINTIYKTWH